MVELDKDIPAPVHDKPGRPPSLPYAQMAIGDSFFSEKAVNVHHAKRAFGYRFTQRKVTEAGRTGYRTWRVE